MKRLFFLAALFAFGLFAQVTTQNNLITYAQCDPLNCSTNAVLPFEEGGQTFGTINAYCQSRLVLSVYAGCFYSGGCPYVSDIWSEGNIFFVVGHAAVRKDVLIGAVSETGGGGPVGELGHWSMLNEEYCNGQVNSFIPPPRGC